MSEARIGRVLTASLHQAISDLLPTRLEFYENWLHPSGLRGGTIGRASLTAVLSFLRHEDGAYMPTTERAGELAAQWTVDSLPGFRLAVTNALPVSLRARATLWIARRFVRATYGGSRASVSLRRGNGSVDITGSIFCDVREKADHPLCGFYAAAITRLLDMFAIEADACVSSCRANGGANCRIAVVVRGARVKDGPA